jgi:Mn-dependent DtxR family transcriptional regulator
VRVPDDIWEAAKAEAEARDETVSDVIVAALEKYTRRRRHAQKESQTPRPDTPEEP